MTFFLDVDISTGRDGEEIIRHECGLRRKTCRIGSRRLNQIPAGARPARRAGRPPCRQSQEASELGARRDIRGFFDASFRSMGLAIRQQCDDPAPFWLQTMTEVSLFPTTLRTFARPRGNGPIANRFCALAFLAWRSLRMLPRSTSAAAVDFLPRRGSKSAAG